MNIVRKHFEKIDSTNNWAKLHGETLDPESLTLITAHEQTGGRGRFNRKWHSPPGMNIYATYAFFLREMREDLGNIPQLLALSLAEVLEQENFPAKLKWPNDILLSGKKVSGILCETTWIDKKLLLVVGIGLNVNMPEGLLKEIDQPATSLLVESGKKWEVEFWLIKLTNRFVNHLEHFLNDGFTPFLEEYQKRLIHREGDRVKFHDNQKVLEGTYLGLTKEASLKLMVGNEEKIFIAGEFVQ